VAGEDGAGNRTSRATVNGNGAPSPPDRARSKLAGPEGGVTMKQASKRREAEFAGHDPREMTPDGTGDRASGRTMIDHTKRKGPTLVRPAASLFTRIKKVFRNQVSNEASDTQAAASTAVVGQPSPSDNSATLQPPDLAFEPRILDRMVSELEGHGLVGEQRAAKLIYLVLTSRLLDRPICGVVKGPSSTGKSYVTGRVLSLFPPSAFYRLSSMSERALAYGKEPLAHRTLVIEEATGLSSGFGAYLLRSLISEGRLRYETVVHDSKGGLKPLVIERPGPTGLLLTTTALSLDAELETRLFSIPIADDAEQTQAVLQAIAAQAVGAGETAPIDVKPWHDLQTWLYESGEHRVVIPYAGALARAIPPIAIRLRRDFGALSGLIQTHAILHQCGRSRDEQGRIVASAEDYAAVYDLMADLVSAGVEASVPKTVRDTVEVVKALKKSWGGAVPQSALKAQLRLDKSTVSRRVGEAIRLGYLVDRREKKGLPAKLDIGDRLPDEIEVLPRPEVLFAGDRCRVAAFSEGEEVPVPAPSDADLGSTESSLFRDAAE
jgi:hypothetical protein